MNGASQTSHDQAGGESDKAFSTLRARLALAGWSLVRDDSEAGPPVYIASRWGKPRELSSLAEVETFADLVGAPS